MSTASPLPELDPELVPNLDDLVTEDDAPVDSIFAEKQQRLLTRPLYSSWAGPSEGVPFLALANVGLFHTQGQPALVPDALLSLDVTTPANLHEKAGHSYFVWLMGKPPDVIIEIVSDRRGGEEGLKQAAYARMRVPFYVIFDPENLLKGGVLRVGELRRSRYEPIEHLALPEMGLGLLLWEGDFEGHHDTWLRWCDPQGKIIPTGAERANRLAAQLRPWESSPKPEGVTTPAPAQVLQTAAEGVFHARVGAAAFQTLAVDRLGDAATELSLRGDRPQDVLHLPREVDARGAACRSQAQLAGVLRQPFRSRHRHLPSSPSS